MANASSAAIKLAIALAECQGLWPTRGLHAKKSGIRMKTQFPRVAIVGKVEDSRVADSLALLAGHLHARGVTV